MPDGFVSLAFVLDGVREPGPVRPLAANGEPVTGPQPDRVAPAMEPLSPVDPAPRMTRRDETVRELTLMRLAVCEAYARAKDRLLEALARDVLGRELALAPCDLDALARAALARLGDCEPLALRVAPGVAALFAVDLPVIEDAALAPEDLIVEVRDGTIDARFALRFSGVLEAAS